VISTENGFKNTTYTKHNETNNQGKLAIQQFKKKKNNNNKTNKKENEIKLSYIN
jgi:hypothetical protein